jgi:two-component system chemotaxis response regulator CheB
MGEHPQPVSANAVAAQASPNCCVIAIAASAGGITALKTVLAGLPPDLPAAVVILQHRSPSPRENHLRQVLARATRLPVVSARSGQLIEPGRIYLARSDLHLTVSPEKRFSYIDGTRIRFLLSSANPLFASAAAAFGSRLIAVVLTGGGSDATDGVQSVKACGGRVIAQDPMSAEHPSMPSAAVRSGAVDYVMPLEAIGPALNALVREREIAEDVQTG